MNNIHYQIHSEDNSKPWILLIHGLFGNLDNLSALRRQFTNTHQVIAVDLPDHGKSAFSDSFSYQHYATSLAKLLLSLNIQNVSVIGHSLGGKVAMQLALQHDELIRHLVVIDIAPVKYEARHGSVFAGLNSIDLKSLQNRKEADNALAKHVMEASTRQFLLKSLSHDEDKWQWRFNLHLLQRDYAKISAAISSEHQFEKPVLFLKGELSDYLLPEHRETVIKLFPNSESKMVSKTGHWLHAEKPEVCGRLIINFLTKQGNN